MNMTQTAAALDASLIIDGISVSKGSNTVSDVIDGVTLSLLKETTTAETIEVKRDTAALKTAVEGFAKTYSDLNKTITDLTAYNTTTRKRLRRSIFKAQLRNIMGSSVATGGTHHVSQIGLSQKDACSW
jgi:flagellar hook-associated protein 2